MDELRVVRASELSAQTAQTTGMSRYAGVAEDTVGSKRIWMGYVTMAPGMKSDAHHHGDYESAIYVIRGHARFRFGAQLEKSIDVGPGDFLYAPPKSLHQEINLSEDEPVEVVVARDSQQNVVINVDSPEARVQEKP